MTDTSIDAICNALTHEVSDHTKLVNNPVVSVVMLAYRHEKYLAQAISGVLGQNTDYEYELVIGEDCSPDATRDIALQFQRMYPHRIRIIYSDKNVGTFRNSQRAILASRGRYIAFCEGDDYWQAPDKLQVQIDLLEADPDLSACHSDFDRRIGWRVKRSAHARHPPRFPAIGSAYVNALRAWSVMTATVIYRSEMLNEYLDSEFNRPDFPFGDYNKLLFASTKGQIGYVPRSLGTWRKVKGSASNAGFQSILRLRVAALECRQQFISRFPVDKEIENEAVALAHNDIMNAAFLAGDIPRYMESARARQTLGYGTITRIDSWRLWCMRNRAPLFLLRAYVTSLQALATWEPTLIFGHFWSRVGNRTR